jgi:MYXO-CTERM domain-containing protein
MWRRRESPSRAAVIGSLKPPESKEILFMLKPRKAIGPALFALLLAAGAPAAAQGRGGGNAVSAGATGGATAGPPSEPVGGLGSPGAPQGGAGVNSSSAVDSPNAVPTLNGAGIDTSLSQPQSANDPNVATETQQRLGDGVDNSFNWGLLGLLGLIGLLGLRNRRRD